VSSSFCDRENSKDSRRVKEDRRVKSLKEKKWSIKEGIVCREGRMYILEGEWRLYDFTTIEQ